MKPKIIQSSKDMLSRSFNPAKCKTALKLAASRLKLLRNKKEIQVKQIKKEIALLLESGQEATARIRVEHVIREEKMMAAYDLLCIYCELILARMPMIESQKTCPADLKEAVTSVLFASPRCGDVPELLDVKKNLMAKYGKDFTTAAIELRPQCGVGRLLVEKLSAASPDGQTKINILTKIAQEHNVAWISMSLDEKDMGPHMDPQSGPSTPGRGTHGGDGISDAELFRFETTEVKPHLDNVNMRSSLTKSVEHVPGPSVGTKKPVPTSAVSMSNESRARPSGRGRAQPFQVDSSSDYLDRQKWNLEFKDAASAAQAAFESAERASAAARAVAELSSRERIIGANRFKADEPEHEVPLTYHYSKTSSKKFNQFGNEDGSSSENAGQSSKKMDDIEPSDPKREETFKNVTPGVPETSRSSFTKRGVSSFSNFVDQGVPLEQDFLLDQVEEVPVIVKNSPKHPAGTVTSIPGEHDEFHMDDIGSESFSDSQSDYNNTFAVPEEQKDEKDADRCPFQRIGDGDIHDEDSKTSSNELAGKFFDTYDSDKDDSFAMNPTYDVEDDIPGNLPPNTGPFSSPKFGETLVSTSGLELDDMGPATFDDSDGFSSEHDEKTRSRHFTVDDSSELYEQREVEHSILDEKHMQPARDEWKSEEMHSDKNIIFDDEDPNMNSNDFYSNNSPGNESRLNIGKLTGGFRQKNTLASLAHQLGVSLSFEKKDASDIATRSDNPPPVLHPRMNVEQDHKGNTGMPFPDVGLENGSSDDEYPEKTSKQERFYATTRKISLGASDPSSSSVGRKHHEDRNKRMDISSRLGAQASINVSDGSNLYENTASRAPDVKDLNRSGLSESPSQSLSNRSHRRGVISRRTKASPSTIEATSDTKTHLQPGLEPRDSDDGMKRNTVDTYRPWASSSVGSDVNTRSKAGYKLETGDIDARLIAESPMSHQLKSSMSSQTGHFDLPTISKSESSDSEVLVPAQIPKSGKASSRRPDAKFSQKSSASGKPSSPEQRPAMSTVGEPPNAPTFGDNPESIKSSSHVHPKLPDYDTLVQSLRRRQS